MEQSTPQGVCSDLTLFAFLLSVQFALLSVLLHSFTKAVHRKEFFIELFTDITTSIFWVLGVNLDLSNQFEVPCICRCEFSSSDVWSIHMPLLDLLILQIEISLCQPVFYWFSCSPFSKSKIQETDSWNRIVLFHSWYFEVTNFLFLNI